MGIGVEGDACNSSDEFSDRSLVPAMQFTRHHHQEICEEEQLIILKVLHDKRCDLHQVIALCFVSASSVRLPLPKERKGRGDEKKYHCAVIVNFRELDDVEQS